jgi:hypothetical protein
MLLVCNNNRIPQLHFQLSKPDRYFFIQEISFILRGKTDRMLEMFKQEYGKEVTVYQEHIF